MSPRLGLLATALLGAGAAAPGCGYTAGFALDREGIESVGVEIVANETFRQRLEFPLTRGIQREIEARAGVKSASPARADAVLRVRLRSAREYPVAEGARDAVVVGSLVLAVDAELVHRKTGRVVRKGRVADRGEFILPAGEGYADALETVSAKIARRVVLLLDPEIATLMALRGSRPGTPLQPEGVEDREPGRAEDARAGQLEERPLDP